MRAHVSSKLLPKKAPLTTLSHLHRHLDATIRMPAFDPKTVDLFGPYLGVDNLYIGCAPHRALSTSTSPRPWAPMSCTTSRLRPKLIAVIRRMAAARLADGWVRELRSR